MSINGYHHIGLSVKDMDKSFKFYTDGLGGKVTHSFPMGDSGKEIFLIDLGGNAVVELLPNGYDQPEANARWAHIALTTTDIQASYDQAIAAGAVCRSAPNSLSLGSMNVSNAFVFGPDQEIIEFFQVF